MAQATIGYDERGKRVYLTRFGTSKSVAIQRLRDAIKEHERGETRSSARYRVADAAREWLEYGLAGRDDATKEAWRSVVDNHVIPGLGDVHVKDLTPHQVDQWLHSIAPTVGKATLVKAHGVASITSPRRNQQPGLQERGGLRGVT